jgi:uncharacterized protein (TIGR02266 family)
MTEPDAKAEPSPPQAVATDADADESNKRKHPRADLSLLIQFRFDSVEEFLAEYSTDISIGGMFIRTREPREEGSFIYLQFALRDGSQLIEGLGKVVRVNPPDEPNREAGMGIEFVNFDEESMAVIEEIVAQRLQR